MRNLHVILFVAGWLSVSGICAAQDASNVPVAAAKAAAKSQAEPGEMPNCPAEIPKAWLAPDSHPRFFCTQAELAEARKIVTETAWGKKYLAEQQEICARFVKMTPEQLQALVPPPASKITYGLGMNLDPVLHKRLLWAGWDAPFSVKDSKGNIYPNTAWPDTGEGAVDPKTGERYYFVARANGFVLQQLEEHVLPSLADVYALTGSQEHARAAALIFDALARLYPTNRRGPMDYPGNTAPWGGRLDRPGYRTARGLMNYVTAVDLLAPSGEFDKPSLASKEKSIRDNLIRNMLWDGGAFCYHHVTHEREMLHNGHADYLRGAAMVGILLGVRDFAEPMFAGPRSMEAMLGVNIDRGGFYFELSSLYEAHTRGLYLTIAEMIESARTIGWSDVKSAYADPAMRLFIDAPFNHQEVGGHVPMIGDCGPDRTEVDPMARRAAAGFENTTQLSSQIMSAWVRLVRGPEEADRLAAARLLRDSFAPDLPVPPQDRWTIYHMDRAAVKLVEQQAPDVKRLETASIFSGQKGFAVLRGGEGSKRYGAQLFFGPIENHGQLEALTWTFFDRGLDLSYDPGYGNTHWRFGWLETTVAHESLVVDQRNCERTQGNGHLLAWRADPQAQWALARHEGAYAAQGVKRYERLIAQVHNPATGEAAYWLDVGRVEGGATRDDSFHSQMKTLIESSVPIPAPDPQRPSLYGDKDLGGIIGDDMRLKGPEFADKPFYWAAPGEGYGFLGSPREIEMSSDVRMKFGPAAFSKKFAGTMVVDFLGAPSRRLIVADAPGVAFFDSPRVPYVIRRDAGPGSSLFAKVIHLVDDAKSDPIASVSAIPVAGAGLPAIRVAGGMEGAWCVTWTDGARDVWFLGDEQRPEVRTLSVPGLPAIETDALVALVRFDAAGAVRSIAASAATEVKVKDGPQLTGVRQIEGRLEEVQLGGAQARFRVAWKQGAEALGRVPPGALLYAVPEKGFPSTWQVAHVEGGEVTLVDVKPTLAKVTFDAVKGKPGWYATQPLVSWFTNGGERCALGKCVCREGRPVGRIAESASSDSITVESVKIVADGKPVDLGPSFDGVILDAGPGDKAIIPLDLAWSAQ